MTELNVPEGLTDVKPIREIIYEYLRQAILDGEVKPGARLVERDIASQLKASRTPVREALRKLETEGFIEYQPRKGVVVRGFNLEEIEEIYSIRKVLECLLIRSAISKITDEKVKELEEIVKQLEELESGECLQTIAEGLYNIDGILTDIAQMPLLKNFLLTLQSSLQRYRRINLTNIPRRKNAIKEHRDILQAMIDHDMDRAERLVGLHIDNSRKELMKRVSSKK